MSDSCLKYHGGKSSLAPKLIELFPPHVQYVEPYCGGCSVLFNKPNNLIENHSEVVNDVYSDLINFWRVFQDPNLFGDFVRVVEATPFSEYEFNDSENSPPRRLIPNLTDAVKFFVRNRQSRQGLGKDFATLSRTRTRRKMNEQCASWLSAIDGLEDIHNRLSRVIILNRPALDIIRQQDGPETLFYLDPPYYLETRVTRSDYKFEMTNQDHQELLEALGGIKGKFLLSGYDNPLYSAVATACGWSTKIFTVKCSSSSKSTKESRIEQVWANYKI